MATTSEIQVTEAYIGLLGRAPDPAGLAYWAAQLDAAIAGGEDAAVALKKLTNDITLSAEWDGGLGALVATDGSITQANAESLVNSMYLNLFERAATTADKAYWSAELVAGTTTASEMAVQLIQGAKAATNTTDASVLGFKQEAATYYVENVVQADFNRESATSSVSAVDGPITLQASKDATDIIVSGVGVTFAFTTATDTVAVTGGDDTATGVVGTGATYATADTFNDRSSTDNDTLTISGDGDVTMGTTANVENINISLAKRDLAGGFTVAADKLEGGDLSITVAETVSVGGVNLAGEQTVSVTDLASDLSTTNVKALTVTLDPVATQTIAVDNDGATVDVSAVDANDTTITLANNDVAFAVSGTTATNDAMTVSADNEVTITHGAQDVENLTLIGSNNDATFTMASVAAPTKMVYTASGSNDITIAGTDGMFAGASLVDSNTGTETLKLTGTNGAASIEGFGVLSGGVTLAASAAYSLSLTSGNTVTTTAAMAAGITFNANDSATDSSITINLGSNANGINTDKFETVVIDTNDSIASSLGALDFDSVGQVTLGGTNDVTTGAIANANTIAVSGEDINIGAVTATNEVTLTATKSVTTAAMTVENDITATAGGTSDVSFGAAIKIDGVGNLTATGDDVNAANTIVVDEGNISLTSTANDVDLENTVTATKGSLTLTAAEDVEAANTLESTAGSVTVAAGNDVTLAAVTAANDVDIDSGSGVAGLDVALGGTITVTAGNVTVNGDDVDQTAGGIDVAAGNITILAANESDLDAALDTDAGSLSITATAGKVDLAAVAVGANDVTVVAGTDIVDASTITAGNGNVTFTTAGGAGNDIAHTGTINATKGNVTLTADDVAANAIDVAAGNIVIDAGNTADLNGTIDTDSGSVTITADLAAGGEGLDQTAATIDATNDITITVVADVDLNSNITTTLGDIVISGNEMDINGDLSAVGGSVKLTATSDDKANEVSTIANAITAKNVNLLNGNFDINNTVTVTDTLTVEGDTDAAIDDIAAEAVVLTTSNDVTVTNTLDTSLVVASGTGDFNLGTVEYDAGTTAISITTGAGNDTMVLDDKNGSVSVYTAQTGDGIDNVTITDVAANSVINTEGGNDVIALNINGGNDIDVFAGAGVDQITIANGANGDVDGGADTDTLVLANNVNYADDGVIWTNIEKVDVSGVANGSIQISENQLDNDGTWEYQETSGVITITGGTGGTINASGITFVGGSAATTAINGSDATNDTITGTANTDVITGNTGKDAITGGGAVDTFSVTAGDSLVASYDTISDFNTGGSDVIDFSVNLSKASNTSGAAAAAGNAAIDANGLATFHADDDTLAEKVAAVAADIQNATANTAGKVAIFQHGGNTYVFITDAAGANTTGDDLIELTGTSLTTITLAGNNFTGG